MALRKLVRSNYDGKLPVSIKHENFHSFKERVILLCPSILQTRRISHLHGSALFTVPLKPFRSQVKGKHSAGKEFQSLAWPPTPLPSVGGLLCQETVEIDIFITLRNGDRKIALLIIITSGPVMRMMKLKVS